MIFEWMPPETLAKPKTLKNVTIYLNVSSRCINFAKFSICMHQNFSSLASEWRGNWCTTFSAGKNRSNFNFSFAHLLCYLQHLLLGNLLLAYGKSWLYNLLTSHFVLYVSLFQLKLLGAPFFYLLKFKNISRKAIPFCYEVTQTSFSPLRF